MHSVELMLQKMTTICMACAIAEFVVPLVKAVQELSAQNTTLKEENLELKKENRKNRSNDENKYINC